jgi:hypothetical protein
MAENSPFYKSALKYYTTNVLEVPVIGQMQYISLTPFPEENPQLKTLPKIAQNVKIESIDEPCDIYYPIDINEFKKTGEILYPQLNQKTFTIFLEITHRTVSSGIIHEFIESMKKIALKKIPILISLFCFGHTLKFPFTRRDFNGLAITTDPDFDDDFFVPVEHTFFDLKTQSELFIKYLEEIDRMQPEICDISLGRILLHLFPYLKALRNPCIFITCDAPDASSSEIEEITRKMAAPRISVQFFVIGNKSYPNISKLVKETNTHIFHYGFDQIIFLVNKLIKFITLPYTRFVCVYAIGSDSVKIEDCAGNYSTCVSSRFSFNKLICGDTIRFFISIDRERAKKRPPTLRFVIQYFDGRVMRYMRVIPVRLSLNNNLPEVMKTIDPCAIVSAAGAKIANAYRNGENVEALIESLRVCMRSDYFREIWDKGNYERVKIASTTIKLLATDLGAIEYYQRTDNDVFLLLSPLCLMPKLPGQLSVLYKEIFQNNVAVEVISDHYLCFDNAEGSLSTSAAIHANPKCFVENIKLPIEPEKSYYAYLLSLILTYL